VGLGDIEMGLDARFRDELVRLFPVIRIDPAFFTAEDAEGAEVRANS
jgi:hypothetical protein